MAYGAPAPGMAPARQYRPFGALTAWTVGLSSAYALLLVVNQFLGLFPGGGLIALLLSPVQWGAIVVAVIWCYRACSNAHALRSGLRWAPGWGAGAWFIPIANLVLPVLVMAETWRASRPEHGPGWRTARLPGWFVAWWALWAAGQALGVIVGVTVGIMEAMRSVREGAEPAGPFDAFFEPAFTVGDPLFWVSLATVIPLLVALPLWLRVVRSIDEGQQVLAAQAGLPPSGPGPSPWAPEETGSWSA